MASRYGPPEPPGSKPPQKQQGVMHRITPIAGKNEEEKIKNMLSYSNPYSNLPNLLKSQPPPGYICNRCGEKGHFIYDCPVKGNPQPTVKRTTGIPKAFLQPATADTPGAKLDHFGKLHTVPHLKVIVKIFGCLIWQGWR